MNVVHVAQLEHVLVADHLTPDEVVASLSSWPIVRFVTDEAITQELARLWERPGR